MEKYRNDYKISISYNKRVTTVDLRRIVAISHPNEDDVFFRVFFENTVWNVSIDQHDRLYTAWLRIDGVNIKDKQTTI